MNYLINIRDFIYYHRKYFLGALVFIILLSMYLVYSFNSKDGEVIDDVVLEKEETLKEESELDTLFVDVKGEVNNPGLYEVDSSKRVMDVIELAGGLSLDADTSNINLSMKVTDEMVIIIPKKEDNNESNYIIHNDAVINKNTSYGESKKGGKVSINNASLEELMGVSGIGEVKAKRIIEYRNDHGKFNSLDELTNVSGIGSKTLEKIKDYLTL